MTDAKASLCPACGAASVDRHELVERASCRVCNWKGPTYELVALPFQHSFAGGDNEMLRAFFLDLRKVLGQKLAVEIAIFLTRWGFLEETTVGDTVKTAAKAKLLARYLAASVKAMVLAIVVERDCIEKERHGKAS